MTNLRGLLDLLICLVLQDHLLRMTNTLGTFAEYVTLSIWVWFSDAKHASSLYFRYAILAHSGISYLTSSSLSSWNINSGVPTHMTGKSIVFFHFSHNSSTLSIVFTDHGFKRSTDTGNLISLAPTDISYIPHVLFNFVYVSCLTKALQCFITFSLSACIIQYPQKKVIG